MHHQESHHPRTAVNQSGGGIMNVRRLLAATLVLPWLLNSKTADRSNKRDIRLDT